MCQKVSIIIQRLFFLSIIFFSCNEEVEVKNEFKEEILLVMEDDLWNSGPGEVTRKTFSQEIAGAPKYEPIYELARKKPSQFGKKEESYNHIIFISRDNQNKTIKNKWKKDQIIHYIKWNDNINSLQKKCDEILQDFYSNEIRVIRKKQLKSCKKDSKKFIKENFGIDICVPDKYRVAKKQDNLFIADFEEMKARQFINKDTKKKVKSTSQVTKYILVFKVKERGVKTQKKMIHHINKALKKIPTQKGSSVKIDERFAIDSAGSIYKGIWRVENTSSPMAGSFVLKEYNQKKQKVFSVGLVYAPSEKKRSFIMRFEALL